MVVCCGFYIVHDFHNYPTWNQKLIMNLTFIPKTSLEIHHDLVKSRICELFMPFAFVNRRTSCGQKIIVWIFIKCFPQHVIDNSSYGVYSTLSTYKPPFHYPWQFTWPIHLIKGLATNPSPHTVAQGSGLGYPSWCPSKGFSHQSSLSMVTFLHPNNITLGSKIGLMFSIEQVGQEPLDVTTWHLFSLFFQWCLILPLQRRLIEHKEIGKVCKMNIFLEFKEWTTNFTFQTSTWFNSSPHKCFHWSMVLGQINKYSCVAYLPPTFFWNHSNLQKIPPKTNLLSSFCKRLQT